MIANRAPSRSIASVIEADLASKMVLVSGPRQCGKTTMARELVATLGGVYFNWDVAADRARLKRSDLPEGAHTWVFDELHKFRMWRNWLKGVYDLHGKRHPILVTGSARLDVYARGGDSLQGRYFGHRMHPLTLSEVLGTRPAEDPDAWLEPRHADTAATEALQQLLRLGGFPEPFFSASDRFAARWRRAYGSLLVREEMRDLEQVRDLDRVELLFDRLPQTVGSLLSTNALREDLEVAFETVQSWLAIFDRLYASFRIPPLGAPRIKAVKKSQKLFMWDWARVESAPAKLENCVLLHLLRLVHWLEDVHGEKAELRFARDVVGHEVDAVVLRKGKPWLAVEVKSSDEPLDPGFRYWLERTRIPHAFQIALHGTADRRLPDVGASKVRLVPAAQFLASLP